MKEQKQYSNEVVVITLVIFLALGAYTWSSVKQVREVVYNAYAITVVKA